MASEGGGKAKSKRYNEHGKPNPRRTSYLGLMVDTVKNILGSYSGNPGNTSNQCSSQTQEQPNHVQQRPVNNTSHIDNNLGQSYLQPGLPTGPLPGPSKLLPQLPVMSQAPVLHRMDSQPLHRGETNPSHRGDPNPLHRVDPNPLHRVDPNPTGLHGQPIPQRIDAHAPRPDQIPFSSDHLPFMQHQNRPTTSVIVNGGDDRSELSECSISTSGCSSMPPHQDLPRGPESRLHLRPDLGLSQHKDHDPQPPHTSLSQSRRTSEQSYLWSGSTARSVSSPASSFSRKVVSNRTRTPSFNVSIFGSPLSKAEKSTILGSGHNDSRFYSGKTTYGGSASQKKRKLQEISPTLTPSKRQVRAKPLTSNLTGVSSTSARRILSTLERMSSPLKDAKKIPSYNSSLADSPLSFTPSSFANAARRRSVPYRIGSSGLMKGPPVHGLATPGRVQIAKNYNLNMTSQQETSAAGGTRRESQSQVPTSTAHSYSDSGGGGSRPGKLKQTRSQHYSTKKDEVEELVVAPDLPTGFTLPIAAMPKFSFSSPSPAGSCSQPSLAATTSSDKKFQFSSPITMDTTPAGSSCRVRSGQSASVNTPTSKPDLSFNYNPASAKRKATDTSPVTDTQSSVVSPSGGHKPAEELKVGSVMDILSSTTASASRLPSPSSPSSTGLKSADNLKKGSVMDLLGAAKTSTDSSSVKVNGGDTYSATQPSLSELFKKSSDVWECSLCMIQNKGGVSCCVACETPKPGAQPAKPAVMAPPVPDIPVDQSLIEKFKKPAGSWECDTCMVNNNGAATKCIACETPKPGHHKASSFTSAGGFKLGPTGGFQVSSSISAASSFTTNGASFGQGFSQSKTDNSSGAGFKLGAAQDSNKESAKSDSSPAPSTGAKSDAPTGGFQFGQSLANSSSKSDSSGGFKFGQSLASSDNKTESSDVTGGFKFGSQPASSKIEGGFVQSTSNSSPATNKSEQNKLEAYKAGTGTSGASATDSAKPTAIVTKTTASASNTFTFGNVQTSEAKSSESGAKLGISAPTFGGAAVSAGNTMFGSGLTKQADTVAALEVSGVKPLSGTLEQKVPAAAAMFSFGQKDAGNAGVSSLSSSTDPNPEVKPAPSYSVSKPEESTVASTAASGIFAFGTTAAKPKDSNPSTGLFSFGQSSQPAATGVPTFGAQTAVTTTTASSTPFTFLGATSSGATAMPTPSFNFSAKPTPDKVSAPASTFNFTGSAKSTNPPATTAATSLFTFSANKPESPMSATPSVASTAVFQFGQSQSGSAYKPASTAPTTTSNNTALFAFGQPPQPSPAAAQPPAFGAQPTSAAGGFGGFTKSASTPAFGSLEKTSTTPFGTNTATPAFSSAAPTPAFGTSASAAPAAPAFGSTANPPAFGTASSAAPSFGTAANTAPAFGTPGQGTPAPAFGTPAATPSFQFGAQQPAAAAPASTNLFQFGQAPAAATTTPSTGFNFGQSAPAQPAAPAAAPPSFGAPQPGSFNFGGAPNNNFSFNAPSPSAPGQGAPGANPFSMTSGGSTPTPGRRPIKKATRKLARK